MLLDGFEWCMAWISLGWTCRRKICCQKNCPYDLGPWGAWRAVLDQLVPLLAKMDRPFVIDETTTDEQMEAWYDTRLMWSERLLALGRLGWTP